MSLKRCFILFLFCCWHSTVICQSAEVTRYINEITDLIKNNSIVARKIDWAKHEKEITLLSKDIYSIDSCKPIQNYFISILRTNGDKHSFFLYKSVVKRLNSTSSESQETQARLIGAHIGYIKVPGMLSFNTLVNNAFSDTIQQLIKKLDMENNITGWIVDLRNNTGGGMRPMLAGVNALIKDGVAGYWVSSRNKRTKWYSYGRSLMGTGRFYKIKKMSSPIAIPLRLR